VQFKIRIFVRGIIKHCDIGNDQRIHTQISGLVDRVSPALKSIRMSERVQCNVKFLVVVVNILSRALKLLTCKIKTRKVTGIGVVFKADIDGVGTAINCRF
jgi:hypothetical protein